MKISKYIKSLALLVLVSLFYACDRETTDGEIAVLREEQTIAQYLSSEADYALLYQALVAADLISNFETETVDALTLFAPTNTAMGTFLTNNGIDDISSADQAVLSNLLSYHLLQSELDAESLARSNPSGLEGKSVMVVSNDEGVILNGRAEVTSSIFLKNGVVHTINRVIEAPADNIMDILDAKAADTDNPQYQRLVQAIDGAGLRNTLETTSDLTIFAPTDAAFESAGLDEATIGSLSPAQLTSILEFHVLTSIMFSQELTTGRVFTLAGAEGEAQGLDINADDMEVSGTPLGTGDELNMLADNGVVHQVGGVVSPQYTLLQLLDPTDLYVSTNEALFDQFYSAITRLQYDDSVMNMLETEFTAFAPIGGGTPAWDQSSYTDNELKEIVDNHLFDGIVSLSSAVGGKIESRNGSEYFVTENDDDIYINGSEVSLVSWDSYNGVGHIISGVLSPLPAGTLLDSLDENYSLMSAALKKAELIDEETFYTVFAVSDAVFSAATGYTSASDIDTLDIADADDAEIIEEFSTLLSNHLVEGVEFAVDIATDLPTLTAVSGAELPVVSIGGDLYFAFSSAPDTDPSIVDADASITYNGVIHEVDGILEP